MSVFTRCAIVFQTFVFSFLIFHLILFFRVWFIISFRPISVSNGVLTAVHCYPGRQSRSLRILCNLLLDIGDFIACQCPHAQIYCLVISYTHVHIEFLILQRRRILWSDPLLHADISSPILICQNIYWNHIYWNYFEWFRGWTQKLYQTCHDPLYYFLYKFHNF